MIENSVRLSYPIEPSTKACQTCQGFDGNLLTQIKFLVVVVVVVVLVVATTYFFSIHEKLTAKQAIVMGKFAEVLAENQSKNVNIISI